jgi:hypothetical protein
MENEGQKKKKKGRGVGIHFENLICPFPNSSFPLFFSLHRSLEKSRPKLPGLISRVGCTHDLGENSSVANEIRLGDTTLLLLLWLGLCRQC